MKKQFIQNLMVASCLLVSFTSFGQKNLPFFVDPTVSTIVDENIKLAIFPASSVMKSTETINDTTLPENFGLGKNFGATTEAYLRHDTIFITSILMAREATSGYKIILTRDSCTVKYFSLADGDIFKINKTGKPSHLISFICPTHKLTFSRRPKFKINELVEGKVELTTGDFWSYNNGQNTKVKAMLTGYFKMKLSQFPPNEEGVFKQIQ